MSALKKWVLIIFFKNLLTCSKIHSIFVSRYKKGVIFIGKSRADYFKERRKDTKPFYVEIEKSKMEEFENKLSLTNTTKKKWLNEKIDEELKK